MDNEYNLLKAISAAENEGMTGLVQPVPRETKKT